jgi:DNA-directed RNA polymerase specialized sigma24 family protein
MAPVVTGRGRKELWPGEFCGGAGACLRGGGRAFCSRKAMCAADPMQTIWGFPATSWSLVRRVREGGASAADERAAGEALDVLCRAYWRPLYAYARGRGLGRADAQDAVQEFFAAALRRDFFARAEAGRGKLRSFLLTAFQRVLIDRAERERAEKRTPPGGWAEGDFEAAEAEWARTGAGGGGVGEAGGMGEPGGAGNVSPDVAFERQWARELIARAVGRVAERYAKEGKAGVFAELRAEALGESDAGGEERQSDGGRKDEEGRAGARRSRGDGARRVAVFRLRKRFGEALRAVVAETLPEGGDVEAELRALGATLAGGGR